MRKDRTMVKINLSSGVYQNVMISNIGWTLRDDNSPWSLSLKTTLPGIKFGVAVGDIIVTPAYGYTNRVPEIVPLSFVAIYGEEEIDQNHDEGSDLIEINLGPKDEIRWS